MKKLLFVIALMLCGVRLSLATTYSIPAGQAMATMQATISAASAGDTVSWQAGNYTITGSGLNLKCGITYTGPIVALGTNGMATATAVFTGSIGTSNHLFNLYSGSGYANPCTQQTIIQYIKFSGAFSIYVQSSYTNLVIQYNNLTALPQTSNINGAIAFDGGSANTNSAQVLTNTLVQYNTIGDTSSCGTEYQQANAGQCNGILIATSIGTSGATNQLNIMHNNFSHTSEGAHVICPTASQGTQEYQCEPPNGNYTYGITVQYNDFTGIHRIGWEEQEQQNSGINVQFNDEHDYVYPDYGSYGYSFACCSNGAVAPYLIAANNLIIFNTLPYIYPNTQCQYSYGIEAMGYSTTYTNNLIQTVYYPEPPASSGTGCTGFVTGITWGNGGSPNAPNSSYNFNYNNFCGRFDSYLGRENTPANAYTPTQVGEVESSGCTTSNQPVSMAPTANKASGVYSFPITVTVSDPGYGSSVAIPNGNTGVWYTTDGSSPVPGSGTAKRLDSGGSFVLSAAATVKMIGFWGAINQPTSYASPYGLQPSAVVTYNYASGGGTATVLTSIALVNVGGQTVLQVGGTNIFSVQCNYNNVPSTTCSGTADSYGNLATFTSTNAATGTISNTTGVFTANAIGTTTIIPNVSGVTSPAGLVMTVQNVLIGKPIGRKGSWIR